MENYDDDNNNDDNDNDDDYSFNSVNFQAGTSRLCMEASLSNTYNMMMLKIMIMILIMMMMIIAVTKSIFKLGPPDLAWK